MNAVEWAMLVAGLIVGGLLGYRWGEGRRRRAALPRRIPAHTEYWVYVPEAAMPDRDAVMDRMVARNPHRLRGRSPIGTREGLLFADVRFHVAVVRRDKNPRLFRPDLADDVEGVDEAVLAGLARSQALVRIRYVSEEPLTDARHLTFLPHFADAVASVADGTVVYDVAAQRLADAATFSRRLGAEPAAESLEFHVRWRWSDDEGVLRTFGLAKVGAAEWRTRPAPADQRTLILHLAEVALRERWPVLAPEPQFEVQAFDDRFRLVFGPPADGASEVQVFRIQTARP